MQPSVRNSYIETEVLTATPQKLQYMLIEAAIRAVERTRLHWQESQYEQGCETVAKAQQIVAEILSGLNRDVDAELAGKVAAIYMFIFRGLGEAAISRDPAKLDGIQRVLEEERETWRQLCATLGANRQPETAAIFTPRATAPLTPAPVAEMRGFSGDTPTGFSIEA